MCVCVCFLFIIVYLLFINDGDAYLVAGEEKHIFERTRKKYIILNCLTNLSKISLIHKLSFFHSLLYLMENEN